jgi:hypothetical protein
MCAPDRTANDHPKPSKSGGPFRHLATSIGRPEPVQTEDMGDAETADIFDPVVITLAMSGLGN